MALKLVKIYLGWLMNYSFIYCYEFGKWYFKSIKCKRVKSKKSDRISSVVNNLKLCGVEFSEFDDGYEIVGGTMQKATINSHGDHRIAMSFAIAGLNCDMNIEDTQCIETSFPNFKEILDSLSK